jgi:hypothetical protein
MMRSSIVPIQMISVAILLVLVGFVSGCAVHYFDKKTGTEHIWGFGHMKMKVAPEEEGLQAIVRGTDVLGVSTGSADKQAYLTLGWHRLQRLDIVTESTAVRLEWPDSNFVNIRVGSSFPGVPDELNTRQKEEKP